jgi:hypothetical protein
MKHYPPLESSDIEGMWNGLDQQIITQEQIMDMGVATLSGAGGIMLAGTILPQIPFLKDQPMGKAFSAIVLGLVSGRLLWDVNKEAALGLAGGMGGLGLASLVNQMTGIDVSLSDIGETGMLGQTTVVRSEAEELLGLGRGFDPEAAQSDEILAIGDGMGAAPTVTDQTVVPVELEETTFIETEQERLLGSWIGG